MTNRRCLIFRLLFLEILCSAVTMAQGNLLLLPRRVIFEGSTRYEELNLANSGKDTARYVISLMHVRLAPGEYRSHLYFRAIPDKPILGEEGPATDSGISIRLIPIFGISIPVIIRVGISSTQVRISDLSVEMVEDTIPVLSMTFKRTGNMSVYGDISVYYTSASGKTSPAGSAKGIAVYTPNTARRFRFTLDKKGGIDYHSGRLSVEYTTAEDIIP